jgi:hypothetical protein
MTLSTPPLPQTWNYQQFQVWWQQQLSSIQSELGALEAAQEFMADLAPITITADYTGVVSPSAQLPKSIAAKRYNGATDVTAECEWSAAARSGAVTCSINSATGVLTITAITGSDVVDISSTRSIGGSDMVLVKSQSVTFSAGTAPDSDGTGTRATVNSFSSFDSSSYTTVATISAKAGATGQIQLAANLTVTASATGPVGGQAFYGIWSDGGGTLGTDTQGESCLVTLEYPDYVVNDGSISVSYLKTGLTPGTTYSFDLKMKRTSGSHTLYPYGTASAVGS